MRFVSVVAALVVSWSLGSGAARAENLTLACLDVGRMVEACRAAAARFGEATGNTVRVVSADATARDALDRYGALFGVASPRLDVIQFPEGWGPALAGDLATLTPPQGAEGFIPQLLSGGRFGGRLVGLPQTLAITLLFLRDDVVKASDPSVWANVREALVAAPADGAAGLSFGGAGPTLFTFFLDWLYSYGASGLDDRGTLLSALQAIDQAVGTITSPTVVATTPAEALTDFTNGNTAALVARSTALPAVRASPLSDEIRAVVRPSSSALSDPAPILASVWYLGVSRYSAHQEAAAELARFLVSPETERLSAVDYGLAPTRAALYRDAEVVAASPVFEKIAAAIPQMRLPPVARYGLGYLDLSDRVSEAVRQMLRGEAEPEATAAAIVRAARRASRQVDG